MKTPEYELNPMHENLLASLATIRRARGFRPLECLRGKIALLNRYFDEHGLRTAVLGISGGIDSAVTLGILSAAARRPNSPIRRIVAAPMPVFAEVGATNQSSAREKGLAVARAFGAELAELDLSEAFGALRDAVQSGAGLRSDPWADGQLVSYIRTPALYYLASLHSARGERAIVCGTTNRDEGAYLGFFGKASDGMVDLQIVSDLHKSEVYALGKLLGVPQIILSAAPHGDVYDGKSHLEMIGTPYDFVELYNAWLALTPAERDEHRSRWTPEAAEQFNEWSGRIEWMHGTNLHKYLGGSPSVHLDIYPRGVPGGWSDGRSAAAEPALRKLVNEFAFAPEMFNVFGDASPEQSAVALNGEPDAGKVVDNVLSATETAALFDAVERQQRVAVGRDGYLAGFQASKEQVGSYRATVYSPELAAILWRRLRPHLPGVRIGDAICGTAMHEGEVWRAVGVNPAMRYIWYEHGGELIPHYDGAYDFPDGKRRTLMSVVIYLTDVDARYGGATRFIHDDQRHLPRNERNLSDWQRVPVEREIIARVEGRKGRVLLFDHEILHDGEAWNPPGNNPRVIIRTDVIFERCGTAVETPEPVSRARETRLENKIAADPYYRACLALSEPIAAAVKAGFIDDERPLDEPAPIDHRLLTTPLYKITDRLEARRVAESESKFAVLISTGSFAPVHAGHLQMMEIAKAEMEQRGFTVLGGYLSPSHDGYVGTKDIDCPNANLRVHLCQAAVKESDWMMVDPWEALYRDRPVNFTEVLEHLSSYLSRHVRTVSPIEVVYVCGADNAGFAKAFLSRGRCVVVPRFGCEPEIERIKNDPALDNNARVIFASAQPIASASRAIRKGDQRFLPASVCEAMHYAAPPAPSTKATIYLRDDGLWALMPWMRGRSRRRITAAYRQFRSGLLEAFRQAFSNAGYDVEVTLLSVMEQRRATRRIAALRSTVSADPCIRAAHNLGISRVFELSDSTRRQSLAGRPAHPALDEQIRSLPPGSYTLLEDDVATGKSVTALKALLPREVIIERVVTVSPADISVRRASGELVDIGDIRDFIVGSRDGGLVTRLPNGNLCRAPYAWPYVKLQDRMTVPISEEQRLAERIWQLNERLFDSIEPAVTVADCSAPFRAMAEYAGWSPTLKMTDLCEMHLAMLGGSKNHPLPRLRIGLPNKDEISHAAGRRPQTSSSASVRGGRRIRRLPSSAAAASVG